jgi:hypothetical protein
MRTRDGRERRRGRPTDLTDVAYDAGYAVQKPPVWSPDGTTIAYQGTFGDIYTAGSGGGRAQQGGRGLGAVELDWGATTDAEHGPAIKKRAGSGREVRDRPRTVAVPVRDEPGARQGRS